MSALKPHEDCSAYEDCEEGRPSECPREPSRELHRKGRDGAWRALVVRREPGGLRHYLDGKPIHCGDGLELQATEERYDPDGNAYTFYLPKGAPVRYEASQDGKTIRATLHADVAGYHFVAGSEGQGMRFRWPVRR